jgi:hypothetical protein
MKDGEILAGAAFLVALFALLAVSSHRNTKSNPRKAPTRVLPTVEASLSIAVGAVQPEAAAYSQIPTEQAPAMGSDENTGGEELLLP